MQTLFDSASSGIACFLSSTCCAEAPEDIEALEFDLTALNDSGEDSSSESAADDGMAANEGTKRGQECIGEVCAICSVKATEACQALGGEGIAKQPRKTHEHL